MRPLLTRIRKVVDHEGKVRSRPKIHNFDLDKNRATAMMESNP